MIKRRSILLPSCGLLRMVRQLRRICCHWTRGASVVTETAECWGWPGPWTDLHTPDALFHTDLESTCDLEHMVEKPKLLQSVTPPAIWP